MTSIFDLNDAIQQSAKEIFSQLVEKSSIKGRSHKAIVSAIIYIACKKHNCPRSLKEIIKFYLCKRREVTKCYTLIKKTIPEIESNLKSPVYYAKRFCSHLGIQEPMLRDKVQKLAEKAVELEILTGKTPATIASAAIYLCC